MTKEILHNEMRRRCLEEVKQSGWWLFNKKTIIFSETEIIDESNIQTIQQLPDRICFPKNTNDVEINQRGIKVNSVFYSWSDISATGIKKEAIPMEYMDNYKTSILLGLTNGEIKEVEIRDNIDFLGQIGHIIELYKAKFSRQME
jgi:hypothetical protein